jgi:hypothetical protein
LLNRIVKIIAQILEKNIEVGGELWRINTNFEFAICPIWEITV